MYPGTFAATDPDKAAVIRPSTGQTLTYGALEQRSRKVAHLLRRAGLRPGDHVAMVSDNDIAMLEVYWGALRSGLYITAVNWQLTAEETAFVLTDCRAAVVFVSARAGAAVEAITERPSPHVRRRIAWGGAIEGFEDYEQLLAATPNTPLGDQPRGQDMLYSSGTTGRPKGIRPPLPDGQVDQIPDPYTAVFTPLYGFDADTVYLSPAPLYHAAPLRFCMTVHRAGGLVIVMDRFDAEQALELIARHRVTHTQMVPTMLLRILKLDPTLRRQHDLSSLRAVIHAAAPMPVTAKRALIDWLGPIVHEYYSATENYLFSAIDSGEWLTHQGSVGRPLSGLPHILDDAGRELPPGGVGTIWSADGLPFEYLHDRDRTAASRNEQGWTTVGDLGFLDEQGYLYLSDRRTDLILSGGVNVYPQEAENVLVEHPDVADVAVFGIPHDELGQVAHAVVQPRPGRSADAAFATELLRWCEQRLARYKCPRSIDFDPELPRTPTGKLLRRVVRDRYLPGD